MSAPSRGSFLLEIIGVIGLKMLDGFLGNRGDAAIRAMIKRIWKLRSSLFSTYIQAKRRGGSVDELADALAELVRSNGAAESDRKVLLDAAREIDAAFQLAVEPVTVNADQVELSGLGQTITVGVEERKIITTNMRESTGEVTASPVESVAAPAGYSPGVVVFHRIHIDTANAIVSFREPEEMVELGKETCQIVDPKFQLPFDPYTSAQSARQPLHVHWRRITSGGASHLEITGGRPTSGAVKKAKIKASSTSTLFPVDADSG